MKKWPLKSFAVQMPSNSIYNERHEKCGPNFIISMCEKSCIHSSGAVHAFVHGILSKIEFISSHFDDSKTSLYTSLHFVFVVVV